MSNFYFVSDISRWFSIKFFFNLYNSSANLFFYDVKMHSSSIKLNICADPEVQGTAAILRRVYFCFVSWTPLMILIPYINAWAISESSIQIVKENPIIAKSLFVKSGFNKNLPNGFYLLSSFPSLTCDDQNMIPDTSVQYYKIQNDERNRSF